MYRGDITQPPQNCTWTAGTSRTMARACPCTTRGLWTHPIHTHMWCTLLQSQPPSCSCFPQNGCWAGPGGHREGHSLTTLRWTVGLQLWTWMIIVLRDDITLLSVKSNTKARLGLLGPAWTPHPGHEIRSSVDKHSSLAANPLTLKATETTQKTPCKGRTVQNTPTSSVKL